jgi:hypothetical protein
MSSGAREAIYFQKCGGMRAKLLTCEPWLVGQRLRPDEEILSLLSSGGSMSHSLQFFFRSSCFP